MLILCRSQVAFAIVTQLLLVVKRWQVFSLLSHSLPCTSIHPLQSVLTERPEIDQLSAGCLLDVVQVLGVLWQQVCLHCTQQVFLVVTEDCTA